MPTLLTAFTVVASLCTSSAANCSSGAAACPADDTTSLVQTKSTFHPGRKSESPPEEDTCMYDTTLGASLILPVIHTVAQHVSWAGDQPFKATDMCERRAKNDACQAKPLDQCSDGCEWHIEKELCETLEIDSFISYAQAHPQSAFALYATEVQTCSGLGQKRCEGDCQWDTVETKCKVAHPAYHRVMCTPAWQNLMAEVQHCQTTTPMSPGACSKLGCTAHAQTPECKKWFKTIFGPVSPQQGQSLLDGISPLQEEQGQSLLDKVSGITRWSCGNGEHSAKCNAVLDGAKACIEKGKAGHCHEDCTQDPTECRLSTAAFDSICTST